MKTTTTVTDITNLYMKRWEQTHSGYDAAEWLQARLNYVHSIAVSLWVDVDREELRNEAVQFAERMAERRAARQEPTPAVEDLSPAETSYQLDVAELEHEERGQ